MGIIFFAKLMNKHPAPICRLQKSDTISKTRKGFVHKNVNQAIRSEDLKVKKITKLLHNIKVRSYIVL